jgi:hypothetical protein
MSAHKVKSTSYLSLLLLAALHCLLASYYAINCTLATLDAISYSMTVLPV